MADYRCYFLRPATLFFGAPSSIETTEEFLADTDEQARLVAETMYRQRQNHSHGFEVWQGTRLVHRQAAAVRKN
jgi:hypothetical protein